MTLAVKAVTFGKEVVTASRFGTGDDFDAFVVALLVPGFIVNVLAGSLGAALVPVYVDLRERRGARASAQLLAAAVAWTAAGLAVAMIALTAAAPSYLPFIAAGFDAAKRGLAAGLMWWLVPMVVAMGVRTLWGAALVADEKFGVVSLSAAATPAITIAVLIWAPGLGIHGLALAMVAGAVFEAACLGWLLRSTGVGLLPPGMRDDPELRRLLWYWLPVAAGSVLMASSTVVDQAMAAALLPGSVATLEYGNRLVAVITSLGTGALGVAVVPYFSLLVSRGDMGGLRHVVRRWLLIVGLASLPVVAVLTVWSAPIVALVYQRGSFTGADTALVADVQAFLALQIPFYVAGIVLVRLVTALGSTRALTWISLVNTLLNAVLNLVLIRYMGLPGIALATSLMYLASFTMLLLHVRRRHAVRIP
ncbi:MAG: murein biosynthesis integral membrane protein MurJ [Vicinamibacterales bacterium]